ncbi:alpha/beta hydrolase [Ascidiimonas sp. W6]|uniref:alpha/beta hydrolase n=1 Tax=Ascidiimonas meishanensis TaxID=3128903 RepID=UPI0030EF07AB
MNFKWFLYSIFLFSGFMYGQERFKDSIFSEISVKTYPYATKDSTILEFDFYHANKDTLTKRPLFVFVHGGGFSSGKKDHPEIIKLAKQIASRGYVVASVSYRLTRRGKSFGCNCPSEEKIATFQDAGEDIMDAVLFMLARTKLFQIDNEKIILSGSSAGAEGILNLTYNKDLLFRDQKQYDSFKPAAVVSLAGAILDQRYITKENVVPGIFFHGTADPLVPYASGAHHYCKKDQIGYLMLDGSASIVSKLEKLEESFLFYSFVDANHDVFKIPFKRLQEILSFMHKVVINRKFHQAKITVNKGE